MASERRLLKPPDLQELVNRFGGYKEVLPEAWATYRFDMKTWLELHRRKQGAVLDDDPLAQQYARQTGQHKSDEAA